MFYAPTSQGQQNITPVGMHAGVKGGLNGWEKKKGNNAPPPPQNAREFSLTKTSLNMVYLSSVADSPHLKLLVPFHLKKRNES